MKTETDILLILVRTAISQVFYARKMDAIPEVKDHLEKAFHHLEQVDRILLPGWEEAKQQCAEMRTRTTSSGTLKTRSSNSTSPKRSTKGLSESRKDL